MEIQPILARPSLLCQRNSGGQELVSRGINPMVGASLNTHNETTKTRIYVASV